MRVVVTGASGLLGVNLLLEWSGHGHEVLALHGQHAIDVPHVETRAIDLLNTSAMVKLMVRFQPAWIVHAAAMTAVDECERHPVVAMRVNAAMARGVALAAHESGVRMALISTDSVFDGLAGFYNVTDAPSPVNVYARSKLAGEVETTAILPEALVVRTNMYGWNAQRKLSLAEFMLQQLRSGKSFTGFDDVIFSPLLVNHLGAVLLELMTANAKGVLHVGARDAVTKFEFGRRLARLYGLDAELVQRGSLREARFLASRPPNTSLNVSSVTHLLSHDMPSVDEGLAAFKELDDQNWPTRLNSCMKG